MAEAPNQWKYVAEEKDDHAVSTTEKATKKKLGAMSWSVGKASFHHKTPLWYVLLIGGTLIFAALVHLLIHDKITTSVIIFAGLMLAYFAGNQPESIAYTLDDTTLTIDNKTHPLSNFRSFFMVNEAQAVSIVLIPLRRFMPALTIYCEPADAAKVTNLLSNVLPLDKNREDIVDRFMRSIKF